MSAPNAASTREDRFHSLTPASLSSAEQSSVVALALKVLSGRFRRGRTVNAPGDIQQFLRLKLSGRRNEVFGVVYLDARNRLIEIAELFQGTVDGAAVYPRVVVQKALDNNAAAILLFHPHPLGGKQSVNLPTIGSVLRKIFGHYRLQLRQRLTAWSSRGRLNWLMCVPSS